MLDGEVRDLLAHSREEGTGKDQYGLSTFIREEGKGPSEIMLDFVHAHLVVAETGRAGDFLSGAELVGCQSVIENSKPSGMRSRLLQKLNLLACEISKLE